MAKQVDTDVLIIGAGHNGLTTAGYLARAGYSVKVVERRHVVGGTAVTEEFHPGFRNSVCSYVVSMLQQKIIDDLELNKYGLNIMMRDDTAMAPLSPEHALLMSSDDEQARKAIEEVSPNDWKNLQHLGDALIQAADVLRDVVLEAPANIGGGFGEIFKIAKVANRMRKLSPEVQHTVIKMFTMSISEFLDEYLEHTAIKAMYGIQSFIGTYTSPYAPGSAYILLHHYFGIIHGKKGGWGHAEGGMGSITQAMAKSAEAYGADIEVSAPVEEVIIENGVARGVRLEGGREIRARVVAANTNPKLLFEHLIKPEHLEPVFLKKIQNYRCHSATFRMNVALDEMPDFTCLKHLPEKEKKQYLAGGVMFAQSIEYFEQAYIDARLQGYSKKPIMELYVPTTIDSTLAPEGKHVMSLFCQHFLYEQPDGRDWDDIRDEVADHIIDYVTEYAPNFKSSIVGRQIKTPKDLEREFGLIGGDIFHGVLAQDQVYAMRPTSGAASYKMPVDNLYLCGSGAHPGGGVTGCPGHNAAQQIMKDLKFRRVVA